MKKYKFNKIHFQAGPARQHNLRQGHFGKYNFQKYTLNIKYTFNKYKFNKIHFQGTPGEAGPARQHNLKQGPTLHLRTSFKLLGGFFFWRKTTIEEFVFVNKLAKLLEDA